METRSVVICSRNQIGKRKPIGPFSIVEVETPVRILVKPGCKAEMFTVEQGIEINIRYSSKVIQDKTEPVNYEI